MHLRLSTVIKRGNLFKCTMQAALDSSMPCGTAVLYQIRYADQVLDLVCVTLLYVDHRRSSCNFTSRFELVPGGRDTLPKFFSRSRSCRRPAPTRRSNLRFCQKGFTPLKKRACTHSAPMQARHPVDFKRRSGDGLCTVLYRISRCPLRNAFELPGWQPDLRWFLIRTMKAPRSGIRSVAAK